MSAAVGSRGRGRPRDSTISHRALDAARALLVERGFDATTMQAVADRAGLHASALYRRWSSRIELIEEATFPGLSPVVVKPTGDLRIDLSRFFGAYLDTFNTPAARAAAGGLLAHHSRVGVDPASNLHARVSARPQFKAILRAADVTLVDRSIDPDEVFDLVLGAVLVNVFLARARSQPRSAERSVELVMRMLRPGRG